MNFHVFDMQFNRLGIIKKYDVVTIEHNYLAHSRLEFELAAIAEADEFTDEENYEEVRYLILGLIFSQSARDEGRIICKESDLTRGYYVRTEQYLDSSNADNQDLKFTGYSLSYLMRSRSIPMQRVFEGNIEQAMRYYVNKNCVNPDNPNRIVPNLILSNKIQGISIDINAAFTETFLDETLFEIGTPHNVTYEVLMDHELKKYVFVVYQGLDRSDMQTEREPVIFAKKFGNVSSESFIDDRSAMKTTAVVIGYYEESLEPYDMYVYSGDDKTGFNRWEIVVDARDVESIYTDDDDVDHSMTEKQYEDVLKAKGESTLVDYSRIQTFSSEIDSRANYIFGVDYFLGDIIASQNDELGVTMRRRLVQASETFTKEGYTLTHNFGDPILQFTDVLKRELKHR